MIQFGIVGCGHIAAKHVEAIELVEGAQLHAVCDMSMEQVEGLLHKTNSLPYNIQKYTSFEQFLEDSLIDVVIICTPSGLHADMAVKAALAGKHVIIEKPVALTREDAERVTSLCRHLNRKLAVVHPNRYRPAIMELKRMFDQGEFGKISHISLSVRWNRNQEYYNQSAWRGTKQMDGGVLMNQGIHSIDLLVWLMGSPITVHAMTATRLRDIEAEDVAIAVLQFADQSLGVVEVASTIYPNNLEEEIAIFGEKGTAIIGGPTAHWIKNWTFESMSASDSAELIESINDHPYGEAGHIPIIRDMVQAIQEDREPSITGADGANALDTVLRIYEAAVLHEEHNINLISR